MEHLTLQNMTEDVIQIFKEYEQTGTRPWTAETAVKDLSYQVGSLMKAYMQLSGDRYRESKTDDELKKIIGDECADICAEVLFIAFKLNIDFEKAWQVMKASDTGKIKERLNENSKK